MTIDEVVKNFYSQSEYSISIDSARSIVKNIYDDLENATCETCKWLKDEVCTNSESAKCADFPDLEMMCNKWEKIL